MIDELITEASRGWMLQQSTVLPRLAAKSFHGPAAVLQIMSHADFTSYHLLWALRQAAPALYQALPNAVKAQVLADALAHVAALNDFGYLDPSDSFDGDAASALLALGCAAIAPLEPLLQDGQPAPLFGSEPATLFSLYQYRRKDFAFRYLTLLTGGVPTFDPDPAVRDVVITQFAAALPRHRGGACP